jgi:Holliday junction resolvasome RuvABC endonuclease subunit
MARLKVLAVDPGTIYTGFSYYEEGVLHDWGLIKAKRDDPPEIRSVFITDQLSELVDQFSPYQVICEMPHRGGPGAKKMNIVVLFTMVGMICYMCRTKKISFAFIDVSDWKGQIKKKQHHPILINQIKKAYDIDINGEPEDTIDAIGLGHWFMSKLT